MAPRPVLLLATGLDYSRLSMSGRVQQAVSGEESALRYPEWTSGAKEAPGTGGQR